MQNRLCLLLFLCAAVLARGEWISTAETGSYNDPANWRNGLCDDTFSGPEAPLTRTVLSVEADRLVGPDGLRIRHDAAAALVLEGVGGPRTFNFPEGGAILVDIGGASDAVAVRTGVQNSETARIDFDFGANPAIVSLSPDATSGRDTLSCFGSIRGRSFRREGDGTLKLYGAIETANGEAAFLGGTTYLYNWGVSGTHGLPGLTTLRLESGAKLSLQSAVNPQTVTLSGGFLQSGAALTADTLELLPGRAVLIARDNADFSFGAIRRTEASFLTLGANEAARIGAGSLIRLSGENATNLLAECVGGGVPYSETPDSSRISIVPWAGASSFSTQESFETSTEAHDPALPVAFDAALGFVTLPESSLLDGLSTATLEDNVLISEAAVTLETDAAANCLVLKTWGTTLDLNTNTLTLASGLLLHRNTKPTLRNGTLALGTEPLRAFGRQNLTISSTITSPNTDPDATIILTASAGGGGLVLSGDNRGLTGTILVAAGTLSASGYGVPDTVGIELCRGTRYPVTWGGATSRARAIGGIGAIQAGDNKNRLLIGAAEPSAATGVWVGPGGALTPGERNPLTGRRSGTLTVGDKFTHIVFQEGSTLVIDITDAETATALDAASATVELGGTLAVRDAAGSGCGPWTILTARADASADTITGAFAAIPEGFRVESFSTEGYDTVNALRLLRDVRATLLTLR